MYLRASVLFAALLAFPLPAIADARADAKAQVEFGIKVAQNGLWKEATYRWEKAMQIDLDLRRRRGTTSRSATNTRGASTMRTRLIRTR